jgi:LytS/YehU family sensor histidine kinase
MHYLHQFSRLLRTVLECSEKSFIRLSQEIILLELYLELESMRFDKQFHYNIVVHDEVDSEDIMIPTFLLQPFVENALWHGLMHKTGDRRLTISFLPETDDVLLCKISDNGIGRKQASRIKSKSIKAYQPMSTRIIRERIELMKKQNNKFDLEIIDEADNDNTSIGTTVLVKLHMGFSEMPGKSLAIGQDRGRENVQGQQITQL